MKKSSTSFRGLEGMTESQVMQMVNWQDSVGHSPLHIAIRNGVLQHVVKLLALGADCNLPDADGNTPLHLAAQSGNLEILNAVADATDDLDLQNNAGETPVLLAAHAGSVASVVSLVSMDKHVVPADASIVDERGRNLLMHACISGNLDLVRLILSNREGKSQKLSLARVSVNEQDKEGVSALMFAAMEGHWHLISLLLLLKANISAKDCRGYSALHWAASQGNAGTVSALVDCGAVIDELDEREWSALMHAVSNDNVEIAELLLDCGSWPERALALATSERMHEVVCDSLRDLYVLGKHLQFPPEDVKVSGRLTVSVLRADDLYIDASAVTDGTDDLVVYAVVEFKSSGSQTESQMVALTEGVAVSSSCLRKISWNESLQFFLRDKTITKDAVLSIELFATRDHSPISNLFSLRHSAGEDAGAGDEDDETKRARMDAMYTGLLDEERNTAHAANKKAEDEVVLTEHKRRWAQLVESRKRLAKYFGIHLPLPPVPEGHLPCGSLRFSFARLRQLFRFDPAGESWAQGNLVALSRSLRSADRGKLKIELDFVPSPLAVVKLGEEQQIPLTPRECELPVIKPLCEEAEFFNFKPSLHDKLSFATRHEKLAHQANEHYVRWWPSMSRGADEKYSTTTRSSFKEEETALVRIVGAIAKQFIKIEN